MLTLQQIKNYWLTFYTVYQKSRIAGSATYTIAILPNFDKLQSDFIWYVLIIDLIESLI